LRLFSTSCSNCGSFGLGGEYQGSSGFQKLLSRIVIGAAQRRLVAINITLEEQESIGDTEEVASQ
jgi:hypothetical protein